MRVLIYSLTSGAAVRELETTLIEDARFGLNPAHAAIELPEGLTCETAYVEGGEVLQRAAMPGDVSEAGGIATFSELLPGAYIWVDGGFVGKVEDDGGFVLTCPEPGSVNVRMSCRDHRIQPREWTVNASA